MRANQNTGLNALTSLNFNVTTIMSENSLTNQLTTGKWDVVVIEQYSFWLSSNAALVVQDYVAKGGAVIASYYDIDGENSGPDSLASAPILRATFGVQSTVSLDVPQPVSAWQAAHPVFTTPYAIGGLATNGNDAWVDNGDRMDPVANTAQALAGFTAASQY